MNAEQIKQKMRERGITQGDLCRRWKKPKVTICYLVNKKLVSRALEKRLARLLGVTLETLRETPEEGAERETPAGDRQGLVPPAN